MVVAKEVLKIAEVIAEYSAVRDFHADTPAA